MSDAPVIVIELVLVLGGVLAFAWWQLRDLRRAREQREAGRRRETDRAHGRGERPPGDGAPGGPGRDP